MYENMKRKHGANAYRHISSLLKRAKKRHRAEFQGNDHEQSWRSFKGKSVEKLILHIITDSVESLRLRVINGNQLERTNETNLSPTLSKVKRNLVVDYGKCGYQLPDVDLIIYKPRTCKIVAVVSSKVTLRERVAQTGYWKLKLQAQSLTKHIKVYFMTLDEDGTLTRVSRPVKKGRAIVETDTDGVYVLSEEDIEETRKVKMFYRFIDNLKKIL